MNKKISFFLAALLLALASIACAQFLPFSKTPIPSPPTGRIIYQSNQNGNPELYSIALKGGASVRLTNNSSNDVSPTYIKATNEIGFVSDRQNGSNLYSIDTFGKETKTITNNKDTPVDYPNWSPDGTLIVASLTRSCVAPATSCYYDIYIMNSDGTNLKNLTNTPASEWVPMWSPDGQKIAFSSDRDGDSEIYIINKDGTNLIQLTQNKAYDGRPSWSPDGTKIVFETDRDGGDWDIDIMDADGSNPKPVTINATTDFSPAWSPDGNWLVYVSNNEGNNELYIIQINGENQKRLTNNTYNDITPIWIP